LVAHGDSSDFLILVFGALNALTILPVILAIPVFSIVLITVIYRHFA
jgi:hypothetical protein